MPAYDAQRFDPPAALATVTVRTQDGRKGLADVVMLIDSGSDVTLLPQPSVIELGLQADQGPTYQLVAFDGRKSVANSVQCDVVFLGRAYRGAYLIAEATCGILGRDILNHVSLVLDGPHLDWHEGKDQSPNS